MDMTDSSLQGDHPTISGYKRGGVEGTSKSTLEEMESKAAKLSNSRVMEEEETEEMNRFKKAVEKDPSLLEKVGRDPSVYMKNMEGVSTESEFNQEV